MSEPYLLLVPNGEVPPPVPPILWVVLGVVLTFFALATVANVSYEYALKQCAASIRIEKRVIVNPPEASAYRVPVHECSRVCRAKWNATKVGG